MTRTSRFSFLVVALFAGIASAQEIVATPKNATGVYAVGDKIEWKIEIKGGAAKEVAYEIKKGGLTSMAKGVVDVSAGSGVLQTSLDEPNTVLVELKAKVGEKDIKLSVGAVAAPDKIKRSAPRPDDFDAFWKAKIDQLNAIPANPKLEPVDSGKPDVEYFKVTLDNINGSHVYGQLARPSKEGKYPALLLVQYAGVYPLPKDNVVRRATQGWLALNIMAHDLPFDQPADFYKKASEGPLKDYMAIGCDDRDKSYFLRMYLGCYRAAEYLSTRPDWDGKTLVVIGTSQGGQQSIITAGLHPRITAMLANVPAGCDATGPQIGRAAGFPYWHNYAKWKNNEKGIMGTAPYFDAVNFAQNVKCPSMVSMGLIDVTCPPTGVLAACNEFKGPCQKLILVNSDHHGNKNAQAEFWKKSEDWLRKLARGEQ